MADETALTASSLPALPRAPLVLVVCSDGREVPVSPHAWAASPVLSSETTEGAKIAAPTLDSGAVSHAMRFYEHYGNPAHHPPAADDFAHALLEPAHRAALEVRGELDSRWGVSQF